MSFSTFMRRIFGGEDAVVAAEFDDLDHPVQPSVKAPTPSSTAPTHTPAAQSGNVPGQLADAILGVINAQFPPALADCIDREAQIKWLMAQIGPELEAYELSVRSGAQSELTGSRAKLQAQLDELQAERREVSSKREEQKAALLSEQRQRRALADRNRDLENKINELDSEIEQHKLTISSLMNKMRVAEVNDADSEATAAILQDKENEITELKRKVAGAEEVITRADAILADKDKEIAQLTEEIAELKSAAALQQALDDRRRAEEADTEAVPSRKRRPRSRKQKPADAPMLEGTDSSADLEEIDWLLPGGVPAGHVGHVSDPEFGYQPPKQTPVPDSDAQLTLF